MEFFRFLPQRGAALITVLWITTLASLLAGIMLTVSRTGAKLVDGEIKEVQLEQLAEAAIWRGVHSLLNGDERFQLNGATHVFLLDGTEVELAIQSQAGLTDLNRASREHLTKAFTSSGLDGNNAADLASAVIDWRDQDDLTEMNQLETVAYINAGMAHSPANRSFKSVRELRKVIGVSESIFQKISPTLTVFAHRTTPDESLAPVLGRLSRAKSAGDPKSYVAAPAPGGVYQVSARVNQRNIRVRLIAMVSLSPGGDRHFILDWQRYPWEVSDAINGETEV